MQIDVFHWIVAVIYIICVRLLLSGLSIIIVIAGRQSQMVMIRFNNMFNAKCIRQTRNFITIFLYRKYESLVRSFIVTLWC